MASPRHKRTLIPWALRAHLIVGLLLGMGFAVLIAIMAPAYLLAADKLAGGLSAIAAASEPIARSFVFLTGPVQRLDTIGGYLSYKIFPDIALVVAVWAAIQGGQIIRGAENRGLFDIWFSAGRTRAAVLADRTIAFSAVLTLLTGLIYAGTVVGGALSHVNLATDALGQCAAIELLALFAFALGLLVSQVMHSTRNASGAVSAYLVGGFFIANLADSLGQLTFIRYVSPFYYYIQERTLVSGVAFNLPAALVLLLSAAAIFASARFLYLRRDCDDVAWRRNQTARSAARASFRCSRFWYRWLWLSWIAEQPVAIMAWSLGILALAAIEAAVVPQAIKLIDDSKGPLRQLLQNRVHTLTTDQYLGFFVNFIVVIVAGYILAEVARWAADAAEHRTDTLLAQPVSIQRLIGQRILSLLAISALAAVAIIGGVWLGAVIGGYSPSYAGLGRTFLDIVLFGMAIGGVGALAVSVWKSRVATAVVAAFLFVSFFIATLTDLLSWPSWVGHLIPFGAFESPYAAWPQLSSVLYLLLLAAISSLGAYLALRYRDRVAA